MNLHKKDSFPKMRKFSDSDLDSVLFFLVFTIRISPCDTLNWHDNNFLLLEKSVDKQDLLLFKSIDAYPLIQLQHKKVIFFIYSNNKWGFES